MYISFLVPIVLYLILDSYCNNHFIVKIRKYSPSGVRRITGFYCLPPLFSPLVLHCSSFHCTFTTSFSRAVMDSIYTHHLQWLSFEFFSLDPHLQVRSMSLMYVHSTDYRLWIPTCSCVECSPHAFRCCPYSRKTPPLVAEYLFSNHFVPSSQRWERLFWQRSYRPSLANTGSF